MSTQEGRQRCHISYIFLVSTEENWPFLFRLPANLISMRSYQGLLSNSHAFLISCYYLFKDFFMFLKFAENSMSSVYSPTQEAEYWLPHGILQPADCFFEAASTSRSMVAKGSWLSTTFLLHGICEGTRDSSERIAEDHTDHT